MASGYSRLGGDDASGGRRGGRGGGQRSYGTNDPDVGFAPSEGNSTEFFQVCDKITTHLFTINGAVTTLERSLKQVGTSGDNQALRDRITKTNSNAGGSVQDVATLLRTLQPLMRGNKQRRIQTERLQNEFQTAATRFSEIQKKMVNTLRTARLPADMVAMEQDAAAATTEEMIAREQKRQAQLKEIEDLEFETAMQSEREERMRAIEVDIIDINEIMRDLSSMVTAQGEVIDSIEDNVETAHGNVEEGREQLLKASTYQSKYRRRVCILILILIIILAIVGIIIGIHFATKN
ncbi:syntaxin-12-like [Penaeus chinensis]|uniref:syntaxin-12-like n=1 Tax=Penaeus chinensis TaxID=139456 RepID=UPI001FB721B5|nr:syntaxin-12-like [Penaeus chinensis]